MSHPQPLFHRMRRSHQPHQLHRPLLRWSLSLRMSTNPCLHKHLPLRLLLFSMSLQKCLELNAPLLRSLCQLTLLNGLHF
ncbi:hypothetical protein AALO_G00136060 [Alosa alosa]|uniref:Uncharacterized protein n=1 Tax=Alosa alosa TaxID=278164 RepID=A0AAV6GM52_9TELE|nr:hypothetical protein AALO_G00136060 [Alosa alosa]